MRRFLPVIVTLTLCFADAALAQDAPLRIYCQACRDIVDHPEDVRNFGVNQLYGADSWLTFDQADRFEVVDPFGNIVTVDINIAYIVIDINVLRDKFPYAMTFILQVRIVYPNGDILTYKFDLADLNGNGYLPVPATLQQIANDTVPDVPDDESEDDASEDDEDYSFEFDEDPFDWEIEDGSCSACEAYFDGDQDGYLDDDPVDWIEEL